MDAGAAGDSCLGHPICSSWLLLVAEAGQEGWQAHPWECHCGPFKLALNPTLLLRIGAAEVGQLFPRPVGALVTALLLGHLGFRKGLIRSQLAPVGTSVKVKAGE